MFHRARPAKTSYDRMRGALWGMFVGDALAMPAHWYYDVAALQRDLGTITDYQSPPEFHPGSIMSKSSTSGPGRGSQDGEVVGNVILKGKKHLWKTPNRHYHFGLQAGDNTLNLLCTRVLIRSMNENGRYDSADFLNRYISFMTAPDTHKDTYAESYHRAFFANYARGVPPEKCAGKENHDTASIGGLVSLPPVIFGALKENDPAAVDRMLLEQLRLTHRSEILERYALAFGWLLSQLFADTASQPGKDPDQERPAKGNDKFREAAFTPSINRAPGRWTPIKGPLQLSFGTDSDNSLQGWGEPQLESIAYEAGEKVGFSAKHLVEKAKRDRLPDQHVIGNILSSACYIDQSFPAVLYLAARYADNLEAALVANTNVGGDNCHRGAVLGAIMGAAHGYEAIPERWILGLRDAAKIESEIDSFINTYGW